MFTQDSGNVNYIPAFYRELPICHAVDTGIPACQSVETFKLGGQLQENSLLCQ